MKGIILAGGKGTRLLPATRVVNKHMIPILNNPMITYPLETLKSIGVTDIMIVTGGNHIGAIAEFLGDGSNYGVELTYRVQKEAGGIAQAMYLAKDFVGQDRVAVILGDNIFGPIWEDYIASSGEIANIFVKEVSDPQRFGVYADGRIEEKPSSPKSNMAVTGLYIYPMGAFDVIKTLKPSARGELEITDVNNYFIDNGALIATKVNCFWSDAGTTDSLKEVIDWAYRQNKKNVL